MIIFIIGDLILAFLIFLDLILFIVMHEKARKNNNKPKKEANPNPEFAVLIPARDESKVIKGLLDSIQKQTFKINMKNVYIIVESSEDKTCSIADEYGANIIIREHLEFKRKGYALDEGVKYILSKGKTYDAYFIFDADNVLDENYFENMNKTYQAGYDIGIGYRNTKNGNDNVIAACSTLTFSMINTLGNDQKNKETRNITISGTGFYIRGEFIDKWKGYPFHTLTEDYELTLYSTLHSMTSYYNKTAIFYDEQPTDFKVTITQRTRWVKGFFESRKIYAKKLRKKGYKHAKNSGSQFIDGFGIIPFVIIVVGFFGDMLLKLIGSLYLIFKDDPRAYALLGEFVLLFLIAYTILFLVTGVMIYKEDNHLDLSFKSKVKALFFNPVFLASFVHCAIVALTNKEIGWSKIEHKAK